MNRVMVDIETLGTNPGCAILSIGAVRFDTFGLGRTYHQTIDLRSCLDAGLHVDRDTLLWWHDRTDDLKERVLTGNVTLDTVLADFADWLDGADEIWAFSPQFDCVNLKAAYEAVGRDTPWSYQDERDCRTLASLDCWPDMNREGDLHNALDDARYQAEQTADALREIQE